jgi:hypothetical protein
MMPIRREPTAREEDRRRLPGRSLSTRRSPVRRRSSSPRSVIHRVPPPGGVDYPGDLSYDDAERDRHNRFHEIEGQLLQAAHTAVEAEDQREAEFRRSEEERQRIFLENEARREEESRQRRDQIWHDLEGRLAVAAPVPPSPEAPQAETESIVGSVRQAAQDATTRYSAVILETVKAEREEMAREREAAEAERERLREEVEAERNRLTEEREARIQALEAELMAVRNELENEKQLRITEEAETRERERQETLERDEAIRNQLVDITNLIQDQRDLCVRKKELMDERWEEKQGRREHKDSRLAEIYDMVAKIIQDRETDRLRAEEERAAAEARPG